MLDWNLIQKLMKCFDNSFINSEGEFIAHRGANEYFRLENCKDEMDLKYSVLEWFSRGAYKTCPFHSDQKNKKFHVFMRNGINQFLGTKFTESDMDLIYTKLGNACNHELTIQFVASGYDMKLLED